MECVRLVGAFPFSGVERYASLFLPKKVSKLRVKLEIRECIAIADRRQVPPRRQLDRVADKANGTIGEQ